MDTAQETSSALSVNGGLRVLLFDQYVNGHTSTYLLRFGRQLERAGAEVVVSAPDETVADLASTGYRCIPSGPAASWRLPSRSSAESRRAILHRELELLTRLSHDLRIDHVVHLYGDHVLPEWVDWPTTLPRSTVVLFRLAAHYLRDDFAQMPSAVAESVEQLDQALAAWSRRPDAHAVLTLDPHSVADLAERQGVRTVWLPEPKVDRLVREPVDREGAILYGMLSPRKGLDRLADAVVERGLTGPFTLLGHVHRPDYAAVVEDHVARMRRAGAHVGVRLERPTDEAALSALAAARCVILPYRAHLGMSRVLVEACSVGTPVIVHDFGLLGRIVLEHGIGSVVDCDDPAALASTLGRMLDPGAQADWLAASARCRALSATISDPPLETVLEAAVLGEPTQPPGDARAPSRRDVVGG